MNKPTKQKSARVCAKRGRPPKPKQLRIDQSCITGVHPKHTHGIGLWNNPRKPISIQLDEKLYKAFKKVAIAKFGSVCHPIEVTMAAIIGAYKQEQITGAYPTNTSIEFGQIIINRNTQERRKLTRTHTETDTETLETEGSVVCCVCGDDAVFRVGDKLYCEKDFWMQPKRGERIEVS